MLPNTAPLPDAAPLADTDRIACTISGMAELAPEYEGFILDVWGVIHDGQEAYEGVVECLQQLRAAGKKIWFLSNAPRRAARARAGLAHFGVTPDLYDGVLTSGEMTRALLLEKREEYAQGFGYRYFFIGPERDMDLLDGTAFQATSASEASFVLNVGFDDDDLVLASYIPMLEEALRHDLPMVCANPDDIIVRMDGSTFPCAGLLAEAYIEMGGVVHYIGKPYPSVYDFCLAQMGLPKASIVAVGDNMGTDILGANRAGIDVALVAGGVLSHTLKLPKGGVPDEAQLQHIAAQTGAWPLFVVPYFRWS